MNGLEALLILMGLFAFFIYISISSNWYHEIIQLRKKEQRWMDIYVPSLDEIIQHERSSKFINGLIFLIGRTNRLFIAIKNIKHFRFNLDIAKAYRELSINKNIIQ